jgi:rhamnosyltransferase
VISIVIPTLNGGSDLERCLAAIERQRIDEPVEVVVVDSSSEDGSAELASDRGARVESIARTDFNHGATRNLGASLAAGETLVFTSQDAEAVGDDWLEVLTGPLRADRGLAGVYGRQIAREDARPAERFFLDYVYGETARVQAAAERAELSMDTTMFSNVNAAVRREVWERFPFAGDMIMSEDQEWAARVLLAGYRLAYEPRAVVRHSHAYSIPSAFRRFFDSGVSSERAYLAGRAEAGRVLRRRGVEYVREELRWLRRTGQAAQIPYTLLYEGAKWAGLWLGARHRSLPVGLKRRLSAMPNYWDGGGGAT